MATPTQALTNLQNDPKFFLMNYHLMIVRTMHTSGPSPYWFGGVGYVDLQDKIVYDRTARPGSILGSWNKHNSKNFKFSPNKQDLVGNPVRVMAWHVDVSQSTKIDIGNIPSLPVSRCGGPSIVLTTLLNGCTFVYEPTEHCVLMAHVQPTAGTNAEKLETDIMKDGALANGAGVTAKHTFGGDQGYTAADNDVTIIGVRSGQQWRLFAQIHPRNMRHVSNIVEFFTG